jgi:hypothetical protein
MTILRNVEKLSEKEYRLLDRDSYSSLACFVNDRRKYYRKYILKEVGVDGTTGKSLVYGSLVDCLLFTPSDFDDRFVVIDFEMPTPQMKLFTENLAKRKIENDNLTQGRREDAKAIFQWAYNDTKYNETGEEVAFKRQDLDTTFKKFEESCMNYYNFLLDTWGEGKMIVDTEMLSKAEEAVKRLRYSTVTGIIINQESDFRYEVYKQLIVLFKIKGRPFKSMLDEVIIDHESKTIQPYDLKTSSSVEEFVNSYLKFSYYIQAGVYYQACAAWKSQVGLDDYTVLPIKFIVIDNSNYLDPLIYTTDVSNLRQSLFGFEIGGKRYKGVIDIIDDLSWHCDNDVWGISRQNYDNRGIVNLKVYEDRTGETEDA